MARTRKTDVTLRLERQRTTWTKFHLVSEQNRPAWSTTTGSSNDAHRTHLGPLAGAASRLKVWLGRKVEDSEQAVFVVGKCPVFQLIYDFLNDTQSKTVWELESTLIRTKIMRLLLRVGK